MLCWPLPTARYWPSGCDRSQSLGSRQCAWTFSEQGAGWRCDVCLASNPAGRYRCTQGCDYDVCEACRARVAAQPEPEPAGAAAPAQATPSSFLALQQEQEEQAEAEQNQTAALADVATKPHYTAAECAAALQAYCRLRPASAQNKKIIALDDLLRRALYSTGEPDRSHLSLPSCVRAHTTGAALPQKASPNRQLKCTSKPRSPCCWAG